MKEFLKVPIAYSYWLATFRWPIAAGERELEKYWTFFKKTRIFEKPVFITWYDLIQNHIMDMLTYSAHALGKSHLIVAWIRWSSVTWITKPDGRCNYVAKHSCLTNGALKIKPISSKFHFYFILFYKYNVPKPSKVKMLLTSRLPRIHISYAASLLHTGTI